MKFEQKISEEIFRRKYMINGEKDIDQVFMDVAEEISEAEAEDKKEEIKQKFYEEIASGRFIPGGRILANARIYSKLKNYNNCFTIDIEDSMEGIYSSLKEDAIISSMGGGVGFDISKLRPENAPISKGGESSGPLSFLKVFDQSAKVIHTGGGRRCLPGFYSVQMANKTWKNIKELTIGDYVYFDGSNFKINEIYKNGKQKLVKIITKNGFHISTPNHRWYVLNLETNSQEWIEAQNLYNGKIKFAFINPK